jgi:hypothetical protein
VLAACEDIIEKDISNSAVTLIAPADGVDSEYFDITFYWEPVEGALHYRFQLAAPSFDKPVTFLMDSLVTNNYISLSLDSGGYGWKVRGENGYYATPYATARFNVIGSSDLTKQRIKVVSPLNNAHTNKQEILFKWEPVFLSDKYILTIEVDTLYEKILYQPQHLAIAERKDAHIKWSVAAINQHSMLKSDVFHLFTDFTPPLGPKLIAPQKDTVFNSLPVTLMWEWEEAGLLMDSLFIFDHLGNAMSNFPRPMESKLFVLTSSLLPQKGVFTWGVKSVDKAGNVSTDFTELRKFTYQ